MICGDEAVTYEELDGTVTRVAQWLLLEGFKPGDRVGILWYNEITTVTLYLACLQAGMIALPIISRMKAPELAYIMGHATPAVFFAHPKLLPVATEAQSMIGHPCRILTSIPEEMPEPEESALPAIESDQPALIIYTSGTTALPKGAMHTHRTLAATTETMWEIGPTGIGIAVTSIMHPSGLYCIVLPTLLAGGTLVLVPEFDPAVVLDTIERHRCTNTIVLPAVFEAGVFGLPDPASGEKVIATVSLRHGKQVDEAELREFASKHLNDLKVPERIHFLPELPKGLSGKVDRRALKEMATQ